VVDCAELHSPIIAIGSPVSRPTVVNIKSPHMLFFEYLDQWSILAYSQPFLEFSNTFVKTAYVYVTMGYILHGRLPANCQAFLLLFGLSIQKDCKYICGDFITTVCRICTELKFWTGP
jgi:hypothetical protein